jgi:hypothetical protein
VPDGLLHPAHTARLVWVKPCHQAGDLNLRLRIGRFQSCRCEYRVVRFNPQGRIGQAAETDNFRKPDTIRIRSFENPLKNIGCVMRKRSDGIPVADPVVRRTDGFEDVLRTPHHTPARKNNSECRSGFPDHKKRLYNSG